MVQQLLKKMIVVYALAIKIILINSGNAYLFQFEIYFQTIPTYSNNPELRKLGKVSLLTSLSN